MTPDPTKSCGPYRPGWAAAAQDSVPSWASAKAHDTIGMVAIDSQGKMAAGTSTNGAIHKIPGCVSEPWRRPAFGNAACQPSTKESYFVGKQRNIL